MQKFKYPDLSTSYEKMVKEVSKRGNLEVDERGSIVKEMTNVGIEITNVQNRDISKFFPLKGRGLDEYREQLLNGTDKDFVYTYHERLFEETNQIRYIVDKLNKCKTSRRAIAVTWKPELDCDRHEVPCLQYINFQKRDDELEMFCLFRSNDLGLAYHANVLALFGIADLVAEETNSTFTKYNHFVNNLHLYYHRDQSLINKIVGD